MEMIWFLADIFFIVYSGILTLGYIVYKFQLVKVDTWEEGVKNVGRVCVEILMWIVRWIYEELTGKQIASEIINSALILSTEEVLELTGRFSGHPYDTPVLNSYVPCVNGISWLEMDAIGLCSEYRNLKAEQIPKMATHIIQTYFGETRGIKVGVWVKVASPIRLYVAIPLSEEGRNFLCKEDSANNIEETDSDAEVPLEEEIPIFEEDKNDSGV